MYGCMYKIYNELQNNGNVQLIFFDMEVKVLREKGNML